MKKIIPSTFFNRPTTIVAKDLLGKFLVRQANGKTIAQMVTEVEAYDGPNDKACHACKGKTARTEVMFGEPGHFYIYLIYGMYWMLNIVTGPNGYPAAILIRATSNIIGPGRLTKSFSVDKSFNNKVALPSSGLWVENRGVVVKKKNIIKTPRVGVLYAGPVWSQKLYRFVLQT